MPDCVTISSSLGLIELGGNMTRTHDYQIINDTAPTIETTLATKTAEGWKPVLMSTATINTAVQVFIILEKPIPSPFQ